MRLTTTFTSLAILAALFAFLVTPAGADDEPAPAPRAEQPDRPAPPSPEAMRAMHLVLLADRDRDGKVTAEEWKAHIDAMQKQFKDMDKDGDGALSGEELPRPGNRAHTGPGDGRGRGPGGMRGPGGPGGMRGPGGPGMGGPRGMRGPGGPGMGGPGMGGPGGMRGGPGGPGMGGPDMGGPGGMRGGPGGPGMGGPGGMPGGDLGAKLDRLTAVLEKLLERVGHDDDR